MTTRQQSEIPEEGTAVALTQIDIAKATATDLTTDAVFVTNTKVLDPVSIDAVQSCRRRQGCRGRVSTHHRRHFDGLSVAASPHEPISSV